MEEITNAISNWDTIRPDADQLKELFQYHSGFILDNSQFPQNVPLHAYAAIKDGEFGFYVISEQYDVISPAAVLGNNCFWCPCFPRTNSGGQEIPTTVAIARIDAWNIGYNQWIDYIITTPHGMYQTFFIPNHSLKKQKYTVLFALKNDPENPRNTVADLVLSDDLGSYYDTVLAEPPYKNPQKYYLLDLI